MSKKKTTEPAGEQDILEPEVISTEPEAQQTPEEQAIAPLNHFDQKLAEFKPYLSLTINGLKDKAGYKKADEARKEVKRERLKAEKVAENLKAPLTKLLGQIREREKSLVKDFDEIEDYLDDQVKAYDKEEAEEKARIAAEAERRYNHRMDQINTIGAKWNGHTSYKIGEVSVTSAEIKSLSDEQFIEITHRMEAEGEKIREQERLEEERKAEEKRIADEEAARLKAEAEKLRLEKEAAEKELAEARAALEKEKADREKAEAERLKLEKQAEADRIKKEYDDRLEKRLSDIHHFEESIIDYDGVLMFKRSALISVPKLRDITDEEFVDFFNGLTTELEHISKKEEEYEKAERDRKEAEIKAAEEAAVKAEQDRVAAEKAAAEREEALKPDKQKLTDAAQRIADFPTKLAFTSPEAKAINQELTQKLKDVSVWLTESIQKL